MIKIISFLGIGLILQACQTNTMPSSSNQQPKQTPSRFSIKAIKKQEEEKYAQKLIELNEKNVAAEVEKARIKNRPYLLTYHQGRGGAMKAPGLSEKQFKNSKCKTILLDGMGDSIYGENHMSFRAAQIQYASEFNILMLPFCK